MENNFLELINRFDCGTRQFSFVRTVSHFTTTLRSQHNIFEYKQRPINGKFHCQLQNLFKYPIGLNFGISRHSPKQLYSVDGTSN